MKVKVDRAKETRRAARTVLGNPSKRNRVHRNRKKEPRREPPNVEPCGCSGCNCVDVMTPEEIQAAEESNWNEETSE